MQLDIAQIIVKNKLDELLTIVNNNSSKKFFSFLKKDRVKKILSLYIYGGVGRGKTKLMKDFFDSCQTENKLYIHFNNFIHQIHQELHQIRLQKTIVNDELFHALLLILKNNPYKKIPKIICFDEFQVVDIADAMLLSRLFTFIYDQKITVVFTSNSHPLELYKNGLQRELFIEFVNNVLLANSQLIHLDSDIDYRELKTKNSFKKFLVNNQNNREIFANYIANYTKNKVNSIKKLKVWGRDLIVKKSYEDIAIFDANELFYENLHSFDYHQICQNFNLIFIKNLKNFSNDEPNEIKRLTLFIDEVYESKIALIILSKTTIDKLLDKELIHTKYQFFARTISRLKEIKSLNYWQESKFNQNIKPK